MFNIVFIMDLSRPASLHFITNTVSMMISRSYPVRVGVVPIVGTEEGAKMARVFYYLTQNYGRPPTMRFFGAVREPPFQLTPSLIILYQVLELMGGIKPELDWSVVQARFESLASDEEIKNGAEAMSFDALIGDTSGVFEENITKARAYAQRLATDVASSTNGHSFINGKYFPLDDVCLAVSLSTELLLSSLEQNFLNALQSSVGQALQYFQEKASVLSCVTVLA